MTETPTTSGVSAEKAAPPALSAQSLGVPFAIVIAGALIAAAIIFSGGTSSGGGPGVKAVVPSGAENTARKATKEEQGILTIKSTDHVFGNSKATIVFFEYSDLECPFCKMFNETMKQIVAQEGDKVAWVYRHFPLSMHSKAPKEAEASECVAELGGNDAFWRFTDNVFQTTQGNDTLDPAKLPELAVSAGVDKTAFETCLSSGRHAARVKGDMAEGAKVGVQGTPHTVIMNTKTNKVITIGGAQSVPNVLTLLEEVR